MARNRKLIHVYVAIVCVAFQIGYAFKFNVLQKRLDEIDLKLLIERNERREDARHIHDAIQLLENRLNNSLQDLVFDQQRRASDVSRVDGIEGFRQTITSFDIKEILDSFERLKHAFQAEKKGNARFRRRVEEMETILRTFIVSFEQMSRDTTDILNTLETTNNKLVGIEEGQQTLIDDLHSAKDETRVLDYLTDFQTNVSATLKKISSDTCSLPTPTEEVGDIKQTVFGHIKQTVSDPHSCLDLKLLGFHISGVYGVTIDGSMVHVYCDQRTDGGGWTVFQRRKDGSVNFYRDWHAYTVGFGDLKGEFWMGNDKLHRFLSHSGQHELRVELQDFDDSTAYAKYSNFSVGPETDHFRLTVGGYTGNAGDALVYHNGQQFSTKDRDNDRQNTEHCSKLYKGGWWYNACHHTNLNGLYVSDKKRLDFKNVCWREWKYSEPLKFVEMKFR